jgi:hypothetical protein
VELEPWVRSKGDFAAVYCACRPCKGGMKEGMLLSVAPRNHSHPLLRSKNTTITTTSFLLLQNIRKLWDIVQGHLPNSILATRRIGLETTSIRHIHRRHYGKLQHITSFTVQTGIF